MVSNNHDTNNVWFLDSELSLDFQTRVKEIPEDFCRKDRHSTEQAMFHCLVCKADLKHILPLKDHVKGKGHISKALELKRRVLCT